MADEEPEPLAVVAQPETSAKTSSTTKRRRPRACNSCWQRKIRCDEGDESCRNCLIYGTTCTTTSADGSIVIRNGQPLASNRAQKLRRGRPKKRQRSDSAVIESTKERDTRSVEPQDSFESYIQRSSMAYMPPPALDFHKRSQNEYENRDALQSPASMRDSLKNGTPRSVDAPSESALESVVTIETASDPQKYKYAGKNSTQVLAKSAEELFMDHEIRIDVMKFFCPLLSFGEEISMDSRRASPLIEKVIAQQYVTAYFGAVNDIFPIFIESHFLRAFNEMYQRNYLDDPAMACCIYLVIAIGARSTRQMSVAAIHFTAAWSFYDALVASPYIMSVQALILMTIELMNCNKEGQAILAIGTAIRIAQSLGLHRSLSIHKHPHERGFVQKHYNFRTCIWWTCYCLDKKLSFECGRPSIINDTDCDVELIDHSVAEAISPDRPERLTLFRNFTQICVVLSKISSRLFSKAFEPSDELGLLKQIEAADEMLLEWKRCLPHGLTSDAELVGIGSDPQSSICFVMHCMYYNAMVVIHRAALFGVLFEQVKQHPKRRIASADAVCLNAARSLAKIVTDLASAPASWPVIGWTTQYSLNVIFTLYIGCMKAPSNWMCESDLALIKGMGRCFAQSNPTSVAVKSLEEMLDSLVRAFRVAQLRKQRGPRPPTEQAETHWANMTSQPQGGNVGGALETDGGQEWNATQEFDIEQENFDVQDFFGFGGPMETGNIMQLWPMDFNPAGNDQYL